MWQEPGLDADSCVGDRDLDLTVCAGQTGIDPPAVVSEFDRVRQQVPDRLLQAAGIPVWVTFPRTVHDAINLLWNMMYLFGETSSPEQIGSSYLVLEVQDSTVVGGLYMPHSSFDCFQGEIEGDRLNLSITNSYDLSTYAYSMNLSADAAVASTSPAAAPVERAAGHFFEFFKNAHALEVGLLAFVPMNYGRRHCATRR